MCIQYVFHFKKIGEGIMMEIKWLEEVHKRKNEIIEDTKQLIKIKSVLNEQEATEDAPLGKGIKEALQYMLKLGDKDGFVTKNVGNLAGHIELGGGEDLIGILCHVDVVPEGDGWSLDPFGGEIVEGKIYGRGAIDDKGPTIAAYYAMKIIKELKLPLKKRVRMIIGTDEESNWRCVEHYFKEEEMPTFGFAPDADFPIINAEKGICNFDIQFSSVIEEKTSNDVLQIHSFESGRRYNMVPDFAEARVQIEKNENDFLLEFESFCKEHNVVGNYFKENGEITLTMKGISAHAMEPEDGKNAGLYLASFLSQFPLNQHAKRYFSFIRKYLFKDTRGNYLGINYSDEMTGDLTINSGIFSFDKDKGIIGINMRYPVTFPFDEKMEHLQHLEESNQFQVKILSNSKPHYVDGQNEMIQILKRVYEKQTGEKGKLLSIGGGTYARSLKQGVAFGALFPGKPDVAHQKDEYIEIEDLLKATAIYAEAIYELAKSE